jgi:hypothetical protein
MVWKRMGLLDDAIREHLELKRQRGADPAEVARQERAALASVHDDFESGDQPLDGDGEGPLSAEPQPEDAGGASPERSVDVQETAEIDMRTVLEELDAEDGWLQGDSEARAEQAEPARARTERR